MDNERFSSKDSNRVEDMQQLWAALRNRSSDLRSAQQAYNETFAELFGFLQLNYGNALFLGGTATHYLLGDSYEWRVLRENEKAQIPEQRYIIGKARWEDIDAVVDLIPEIPSEYLAYRVPIDKLKPVEDLAVQAHEFLVTHPQEDDL